MALDLSRRRSVQAGRVWNKRGEGLPVSLSHHAVRNSRGGSSFTLITLAGLPIALPRTQWIVFFFCTHRLTISWHLTQGGHVLNVQAHRWMNGFLNIVCNNNSLCYFTKLCILCTLSHWLNSALEMFLNDYSHISMTVSRGCYSFVYRSAVVSYGTKIQQVETVNSLLLAIYKSGKIPVLWYVMLS